ncbi:unnamed protein product [Allacma fusca]|uniref:Uncharacterized protein n=1 Tax=Allacma fusca TaxID=39272 RepID=A0A8J2JJ67_9HEXA|nr:unnamed protein product [Allacma fusca]
MDLCLKIFIFFKYAGIFPVKVSLPTNQQIRSSEHPMHSEISANNHQFISLAPSGIFTWLYRFNMRPEFIVRQSCWVVAAALMFITILLILTKGQGICRILNQWKGLEEDLLYFVPAEQRHEFRTAQNHNLRRIGVYYFIMAVISAGGIIYHCLKNPFFRAYIYAFYEQDQTNPLNLTWMTLTVLVQPYILGLINWSHIFFFEFISIQFSSSVSALLGLISYNEDSLQNSFSPDLYRALNNMYEKGKISFQVQPGIVKRNNDFERCERSLEYFRLLKKLTLDYNAVFKNFYFWQHFFMIIMLCFLFYSPLKTLENESLRDTLAFSSNAIFFLYRLYRVEVDAGAVNTASREFIQSWKEGMPGLMTSLSNMEPKHLWDALIYQQKLNRCSEFGIYIGDFCLISSSSVLALGSIVTTYLIVLLQF